MLGVNEYQEEWSMLIFFISWEVIKKQIEKTSLQHLAKLFRKGCLFLRKALMFGIIHEEGYNEQKKYYKELIIQRRQNLTTFL